jgi:periplasmic protein TonB
MAYGDNVDPKSRVISLILVGIITFGLGLLLVTGLAIDVIKKAAEKLDVIDVAEEPPPEEPPPPPPPDNKLPPPPPVVVPPSRIPPVSTNVLTNTVPTPPAPSPPTPIITPPAPAAPPATPAPRFTPQGARPRGNESTWVTNDDYPSSAQREGAQGTTGTRLTIGADGRVTNCEVTASSGNSALDQAACRNIQRRARFTPATDGEGQPTTGTYNKRVRWQIPED